MTIFCIAIMVISLVELVTCVTGYQRELDHRRIDRWFPKQPAYRDSEHQRIDSENKSEYIIGHSIVIVVCGAFLIFL